MKFIKYSLYLILAFITFFYSSCSSDQEITQGDADEELVEILLELVIDDLYIKLTKNWDLDINKDNIQFKTPELVPVNPNFIYAYITEYGIIPANQMYNIALNYINNLQKDVILNE